MSVHAELREIEKEQARLEARRKRLETKAAEDEGLRSKVEAFATENGFSDGKALAKKLGDIFGLADAGGASPAGRRKRTKVSAQLRDMVKAEVSAGKAKNAVSKERQISYIVIDKIVKGFYDNL
jgi:hypothetical protein